MKILSIGIDQNTIKNNSSTQYLSRNFSQQTKFELQKDSFIKSTPSFKGGEKIALDKGVQTIADLGAFAAATFIAFKKLMGNEKDLQAANAGIDSNFLQEILSNLTGKNEEQVKQEEEDKQKLKQQADELKQLREENQKLQQQNKEAERLKEDNQALKQQNEELEQLRAAFQKLKDQNKELTVKIAEKEKAAKAETALTPESQKTEEKPQEVQGVIFPKKWGVLSKDQKALKAVVTSISISPEYNEKLTSICKAILDKSCKDTKNKERSLNLAADLQACEGDIEKLKTVVDKYDINKKAISTEKEQKIDNEKASVPTGDGKAVEVAEQSQTSIVVEKPKFVDVKVVGKIDLDTIKPSRPTPKKKQKAAATSNAEAKSEKADAKNDVEETPKNKVTWTSSAVSQPKPLEITLPRMFYYCLPDGMVSDSTRENLTKSLKFFEQRYITCLKAEAITSGKKRENISWALAKAVANVKEVDVLKEVESHKNYGPLSTYKNINSSNAKAVAKAINEESRFSEMFTLHAATRFIERFVDLKSDEPVEEQVSHRMDVLENTIQKALKSGVEMASHDVVVTNKNKKRTDIYKNMTITIPTEYYDDEAKKIFGTYPLKLGLCRNGKAKSALISTIFPQGVY